MRERIMKLLSSRLVKSECPACHVEQDVILSDDITFLADDILALFESNLSGVLDDEYAYEKFQGNGDLGDLPGSIERAERSAREVG